MNVPIIGALLLLAVCPRAQEQAGERNARLDAVFAQFGEDTPGAALAVARRGEVIYTQGYGMANLEYGIPVTPNSIFHVASVSKQFTAMAIVLLSQRSVLFLDEEVRSHIPELREFPQRLTIRHLIHHISGLRDQWELLGLAGWRPNDVKMQQDVLDLVARQQELNFEPGSEYLYCNTGYTLMAEIVRRVSGKSLKQYADEQMFTPLGMVNTHFHDDVSHIVPGRTYAYRPRDGGYSISIPDYETYGATSLFTTVGDLVLWADNYRQKKVGGADGIELMLTRGTLNNGEQINYAFGLQHGSHRGLPTLGHGGSDAGYRAQLTMYPDQEVTIAVLSNVSNGNPGGLARQVAEIVLEGEFTEPAPAATAGRGGRGRRGGRGGGTADAFQPDNLADYVGQYYSPELDTTYSIVQEGAALVLRRRRFGDRPLVPRSPEAFTAGNWRLTFTDEGFTLTSGRVRNLRFTRR